MSVGSGETRGQGRRTTDFTRKTKISPTLAPNSHLAPPISTSVAAIVLEQDDDEVSSRGSEDSFRPLMDLDDPALIISPPPAFRNVDEVDVEDSKSHPVYAEVRKRPKATTEKSDRNDDQQLVRSNPFLSTCVDAQTSTAEGHQQGQQQASPSTRDAPVAAPRRLKTSQIYDAEESHSSETKRMDVDQWRQDSDSARDFDSADELTDNEDASIVDDVVTDAAGSSLSTSSSSSSKPAEDNSTPYPVRWIGSTPISDQLYGKQRTDAIFAVTSKLSSAVDSLGRGVGQLLRVTSSCVETLYKLNSDVIRSYPVTDILEYHALTMSVNSRTVYVVLVTYDRHFGDTCHVFECDDQSAFSLVASLRDVVVTSREETSESKKSSPNDEKKRLVANGHTAIERVADDYNNNSVFVRITDMSTESSVRCLYMGIVKVPKPFGTNMLQKATRVMVAEIPRDRWRDVTIRVTSSAVELYRDERKQATFDLRLVTCLGMDPDNKAVGALVVQRGSSTNKRWFAHGFYCSPSASTFCELIKLAYESSCDSRRRTGERIDSAAEESEHRHPSATASSAQHPDHWRRDGEQHTARLQPSVHQRRQRSQHDVPASASAAYPSTMYLSAAPSSTLPHVRPNHRSVKYVAVAAKPQTQRRTQNSTDKQEVKNEGVRGSLYGFGRRR